MVPWGGADPKQTREGKDSSFPEVRLGGPRGGTLGGRPFPLGSELKLIPGWCLGGLNPKRPRDGEDSSFPGVRLGGPRGGALVGLTPSNPEGGRPFLFESGLRWITRWYLRRPNPKRPR